MSQQLYTELDGRVLCYDGESVVEMPFLYDYILNGGKASKVFVSKKDFNTDEVQTHNKKFKSDKLAYKTKMNPLSTEWNIPKHYKELDIADYIWGKLKEETEKRKFGEDEYKERLMRTKMEIRIWKKRNLFGMLRTLIYVVNTFEEHKIVWGTGRGSSCASYLLYLIGLHQVDSVKYDLDLGEFFR